MLPRASLWRFLFAYFVYFAVSAASVGAVEESEKEQVQERGGTGLLRMFAVFGIVVLLYVLSVGPVMKLDQKGHPYSRPGPIISKVYWPLWAASRRVPPMDRVLCWYVFQVCRVRLWVAPD